MATANLQLNQVVVTGLGANTPLGNGVSDYWQALVQGHSGIAPITLFDASQLACQIAGEVKNFDPYDYLDRKQVKHMDRFAQFAVCASQQAIADAKFVNDVTETQAIKQALGDHAFRVAISSTKSMTGHLLGGSGGIEAVATVMAIANDIISPTINLDNSDPACDLDYVPHHSRVRSVNVALSNSFGFGGHNVTLAFKKFPRLRELKSQFATRIHFFV